MRAFSHYCKFAAGLALLASSFCFAASNSFAEGLSDQFDIVDRSPAPFTPMQSVDGRSLTPADLGGKVVLVNFWATWCPPCVEEMPILQRTWQKHSRDDFEIVAVAVAESDSSVNRFKNQSGMRLQFPIVLDQDLTIYNQWKVNGLPTSFLVDRNGVIQRRAVGGRNFESESIDGIIIELIQD